MTTLRLQLTTDDEQPIGAACDIDLNDDDTPEDVSRVMLSVYKLILNSISTQQTRDHPNHAP